MGINNAGQIFGHSEFETNNFDTHAFLVDNGVMVDLRDLPAGGELSADDFVFVSDNGDAAGPRYAPAPVSIVTRPGEGVGGSDRVTIIWADGAIRNQWLRVYVLATAATGLSASAFAGTALGTPWALNTTGTPSGT